MNTWKTSRGTAVTEVRRIGLGAASAATLVAGQALAAYFVMNACTQSSVPEVVAFQNAWNSDNPTNKLSVDGEYGPLKQGALQNALATTAVPANCFGGPAQLPPSVTPTPIPTIPTIVVPGTVPATTSTSPNYLPWILGGAVLVAGSFAAYTYSKKSRH